MFAKTVASMSHVRTYESTLDQERDGPDHLASRFAVVAVKSVFESHGDWKHFCALD